MAKYEMDTSKKTNGGIFSPSFVAILLLTTKTLNMAGVAQHTL